MAEESQFYLTLLYLEEKITHSNYLRHVKFCLRKTYFPYACKHTEP